MTAPDATGPEPPFDPPTGEWLAGRAASREAEARYYAGEPARDQAAREIYEAIEDAVAAEADAGAEQWYAAHADCCLDGAELDPEPEAWL